MDFKSKIISISGPTASGKSSFAIRIAKKVNGEIINADSMQVYRQLKILSARPNLTNYQKIKHHLYGFHDVKKNFSTGNWLKLVIKKIEEIKKRKKTPILVGGTGLYFKAITEGLVKIPNIPIKFRTKVRSLHKKLGSREFFSRLINSSSRTLYSSKLSIIFSVTISIFSLHANNKNSISVFNSNNFIALFFCYILVIVYDYY